MIRCGGPKEPESAPKRRKIVEYLHEDTATAPDAVPLDSNNNKKKIIIIIIKINPLALREMFCQVTGSSGI